MNFKMISDGVFPNYPRIKKDYHKNKAYYSPGTLEECKFDLDRDYNDLHYVFMFNLQLRSNISKEERALILSVKNKIAPVHKIDNAFNYNSVYMNRHNIILLNPEIIRHLPKGIRPYLLSKEHFDIGWELTKKHIFECFLMHVKSISKYLKQQNEARI